MVSNINTSDIKLILDAITDTLNGYALRADINGCPDQSIVYNCISKFINEFGENEEALEDILDSYEQFADNIEWAEAGCPDLYEGEEDVDQTDAVDLVDVLNGVYPY